MDIKSIVTQNALNRRIRLEVKDTLTLHSNDKSDSRLLNSDKNSKPSVHIVNGLKLSDSRIET